MTNRQKLRGVLLTWLVLSVGLLASEAGGEDHGKAPLQGTPAPAAAYTDAEARTATGWTDNGASVDLNTATDNVLLGTGLLQFGGTTSSFPAMKRSSAIIQDRLADDSAYAIRECDRIRVSNGTTALPALSFQNGSNAGLNWASDGVYGVYGANQVFRWGIGFFFMGASSVGWGSSVGGSMDVNINRGSAGVARIGGSAISNGGNLQISGNGSLNSQVMEIGSLSELLTLSTSGTTTDTTANLLPANSVIFAVTCRVTTTITTATDWSVGTSASAARFSAANATLTAGTTSVGLAHYAASSEAQVAAAKVRITTTGTPGAGAIRITSHFVTFTAPGS